MRTALLVATAALALAAPARAQDPFTRVPVSLPQGVGYESVSPADYDADGDLDLLVVRVDTAGAARVVTELYRNDGLVGDTLFAFARVPFPAPARPAAGAVSEAVSWTDTDNDGDVDALVATDAGTTLYRNDGGAFAAVPTGLPAYGERWTFYFAEPRSSAWADVDNDGDLDLAVPELVDNAYPEPDASRLVLYTNDGGSLSPAGVPLATVDRDPDLTWGDADNDGDLDLLYLSAGPHCAAPAVAECLVLFDNDGGTLSKRAIDFPAFEGGAADLGDFDQDGDLDVLLVAVIPTPAGRLLNRAIVYRNLGATFAADTLAFPVDLRNITAGQWADYDSDGDVDVLVGATVEDDPEGPPLPFGSAAFVFANTDGLLALRAAPPASAAYGTTTWADVDGDGDLDLLTSGSRLENTVGNQWEWVYFARLYRNDAAATNAPPSAPALLDAGPTADGVTLAWSAADDDHTAADALTYNLRVRSATGSDIVSPMVVPAGTNGLIPAHGNVSQNTGWTLRGLPAGTYTWTVQAVDNAFNGGAFSAEGTFTVGTVAGAPGAPGAALALRGVVPNPAAGAAAVAFDLPAAAEVSARVFDALGREVLAVPPQAVEAGAGRTLALDVARLAPGPYVVRLEVRRGADVERRSARLTVLR